MPGAFFSARQPAGEFLTGIRGPHQGLTDEEGVNAAGTQLADVLGTEDAALGNRDPVGGQAILQVQRGVEADVEVVQVAVVDADEGRVEPQGAVEFGGIMDLDKDIKVILACAGSEFRHLGIGQCGDDEQDAVGTNGGGFKDLPGVDGEVLAQHRQGHSGTCLAQEVVVALEVLLIRQYRQAGGPTLFIAARKRHGIEVGTDDALAGAGLLDLGDDGRRRLRIGSGLGDLSLDGPGKAARRIFGKALGGLTLQSGFADGGTGVGDLRALGLEDILKDGRNLRGGHVIRPGIA